MDTFKSFRENFFTLVEESNNIVITSHYSPDDDSIASVLSTYTILQSKYPAKNIRIIYTGIESKRHKIFYNFEKIEWVDDVANHLEGADLLLVLDVSRISRVSNLSESIKIPRTITIDHHGSTSDQFTLSLIEPGYSSNAELIYHAFDAREILTKELAELFLLGILGDTGNLSHVGPKQVEVFSVVKNLIEVSGVVIDEFKSRYNSIPKKVVPLLQILVKNTKYKEIDNWPSVQYTFINREDIANYSDEDISAASHIYMGQYMPRIEGQPWGFVITPRCDGSSRMSGRSLPGSVNVRDLHERLGIGGGHDRASGGYFSESNPEDCISKVFSWMEENKPLIS